MARLSARPQFKARVAGASLLALALGILANVAPLVASPAAAGDVSLDNFTATSKDGDVITIKHAEFDNTNLTEDEIKKILTPDGPDEERDAILKKMKVEKLSIPAIDVAPKKGGAFHVHDVAGANIDAGKIGSLSFSGVDGSGKDDSGDIAVKTGAMKLENADVSAAAEGDMSRMSQVGSFSIQSIDVLAPEGGGPDKTIHVSIASIDLHNNYDGASPKDGQMTIKGLVVEPSKTSDFAASLGTLGYSKLNLGIAAQTHYDAASKALTIDDISLNGEGMGALDLKAKFGDIGPEAFTGEKEARIGALMAGSVSSVELNFANSGLFEKTLAYFAKAQNTTPDALKKQWSQAAGLMLPALLGGDPSAVKLATEAQKFIAAPTNFNLALKPKSGSLKFTDAMSLADPATALSKINVTAKAGK